jgi:hypothetical protein
VVQLAARTPSWQILSSLIGVEHDAVHVRVQVEFRATADGTRLPYFRPV